MYRIACCRVPSLEIFIPTCLCLTKNFENVLGTEIGRRVRGFQTEALGMCMRKRACAATYQSTTTTTSNINTHLFANVYSYGTIISHSTQTHAHSHMHTCRCGFYWPLFIPLQCIWPLDASERVWAAVVIIVIIHVIRLNIVTNQCAVALNARIQCLSVQSPGTFFFSFSLHVLCVFGFNASFISFCYYQQLLCHQLDMIFFSVVPIVGRQNVYVNRHGHSWCNNGCFVLEWSR